MTETTRQKYMDAMNRRAGLIKQANDAFDGGDVEKGKQFTEDARALNPEIENYQNLLAEETRFADQHTAKPGAEAEDRAAENVNTFLHGGEIKFSAEAVQKEIFHSVQNSTTLATGTILEPSRIGTEIRDNLGKPSSILEQVYVQNLTGCNSLMEPILWTEQEAQTGKVTDLAGTARTASDPTFKNAKLAPFEVNVTSFVDRNLSRLTPIAYEAKIRSIAMNALRRKIAALIFNGDGQASPEMFGIKNAKTTDGSALFTNVPVSEITAGFLDSLVFSVGNDEELSGISRLWLNKADLQAIGKLRTEQEKKRIYEIVEDVNNRNTGRIIDGGLIIPYGITASLTALSGATQGASAIQTMVYGDPMQYELGLFGEYSIRLDESVKAVERMNAILGDVMVGGNVINRNAFAVATLPATGG